MSDQPNSTIIVTSDELIIIQDFRDRKAYQKEQETMIAQIVNDGNNRLLDLNFQIEAAKKEIKDKKAKLYELAKEQYQAEQDLKQLREDIKAEAQNAGFIPEFGV